MLSLFTIKRTFYDTRATLIVDVERKAADVTVTYRRRIKVMQSVAFDAVSTPEKAEAWFSYTRDEGGSLMETLQRRYSMEREAA